MTAMIAERTTTRRVATYERVSSEDQRECETIKTQQEELVASLERKAGTQLVNRFIDDGVSGTIPLARRPGGGRLMADGQRGLLDQVWVWKIDRLGRDDIDPLVVWQDLERLWVKVHSATEDISDPFIYPIHVAVAAHERRNFMARSAAGMNRAAREGRYTGGIVPLGCLVEGHKQTGKLARSDKTICSDWSEADLVRKICHWLDMDGWSCPGIGNHLNNLGVPTAYTKDDRQVRRGQRKERSRGWWYPSRIRSIVSPTRSTGAGSKPCAVPPGPTARRSSPVRSQPWSQRKSGKQPR